MAQTDGVATLCNGVVPTHQPESVPASASRASASRSTRYRRRWPMTGRLPRGNRRRPLPFHTTGIRPADGKTAACVGVRLSRQTFDSTAALSSAKILATGTEARPPLGHPTMIQSDQRQERNGNAQELTSKLEVAA